MTKLKHGCLAVLLLVLSSCSSSETAPDTTETVLLPEEAAEAPAPSTSDPFMAADEPAATTPQDSALATPVSPPEKSAAAPEPTPPPPPPPAPALDTPPPAAAEATPESNATALPPVASTSPARKEKNVRQDYRDYQDRVAARAEAEEDYETRALFPHEDGAYNFGIDFSRNAYSTYDFDLTGGVKTLDSTNGAQLSFGYYPIRSLSYGRLGFGPQAGMYWTKFESVDAGRLDTDTKVSFITYGLKATYEFQYWIGQILVPHAFFAYDRVQVRQGSYVVNPNSLNRTEVNFAKNAFYQQSFGGGLYFNLNRLEPGTASRSLVSTGVRKYYLSYTFAQRTSSADSGQTHFLGLRFEY